MGIIYICKRHAYQISITHPWLLTYQVKTFWSTEQEKIIDKYKYMIYKEQKSFKKIHVHFTCNNRRGGGGEGFRLD